MAYQGQQTDQERLSGIPKVIQAPFAHETSHEPHHPIESLPEGVIPFVHKEPDISHEADRSTEVFALERDPESYYRINITSEVRFGGYMDDTRPEVWNLMVESVRPLAGQKIAILSSTFEGGGVAMQIPPLVNFLKSAPPELALDVDWLVAEPDDGAFLVTKKMHNLQQDMLEPGVDFTEEDKAKHRAFGLKNFAGMEEKGLFKDVDVFWFEDPQLVGMLPELREKYPNAKFIFRNHIQTDGEKMATPGSPQEKIWSYLRDDLGIGEVDTYVAHPPTEFWPKDISDVVPLPPVSDMYEDLMRDLDEKETAEKIIWFFGQIRKQNIQRRTRNLDKYGEFAQHVDDQPTPDTNRHWLTGFARFDWAKGQEFNMELQAKIVKKMLAAGIDESLIPHSIITGNGATDDPDREIVLSHMLELRRKKYKDISQYITVVGLEHDYVAVNALLSSSMYTINFSKKEGWEHRRTESMAKGTPSLSSNRGGLPKQGADGQGGHVVDLDNLDAELDRVADIIIEDIMNPEAYKQKRQKTKEWFDEFGRLELTTVANIIRYARAINGNKDAEWQISRLLGLAA